MSEPMKPARSPHCITTRCNIAPIGPVDIVTPSGPVRAHDAPGLIALTVTTDAQTVIAVLAYDPTPDIAHGLLAQMDPATARNFGATLLALADALEGGRVVQ